MDDFSPGTIIQSEIQNQTQERLADLGEQLAALEDQVVLVAVQQDARVRQIAEHRLEVMLGFERAEQNMLLIGDWYTA